MFNTLRPRQNGRHFPDDIFKCIFWDENVWISIKISLKFVPGGPNNNFPALVQIMAWHRPGDEPLSEPMMVSLLTHICVTRPQWDTRRWSTETFSCSWRIPQMSFRGISFRGWRKHTSFCDIFVIENRWRLCNILNSNQKLTTIWSP